MTQEQSKSKNTKRRMCHVDEMMAEEEVLPEDMEEQLPMKEVNLPMKQIQDMTILQWTA